MFNRFTSFMSQKVAFVPSTFERIGVASLTSYTVCTNLSDQMKNTNVVCNPYPAVSSDSAKRFVIGGLTFSAAVVSFLMPHGAAGVLFLKSYSDIETKVENAKK